MQIIWLLIFFFLFSIFLDEFLNVIFCEYIIAIHSKWYRKKLAIN